MSRGKYQACEISERRLRDCEQSDYSSVNHTMNSSASRNPTKPWLFPEEEPPGHWIVPTRSWQHLVTAQSDLIEAKTVFDARWFTSHHTCSLHILMLNNFEQTLSLVYTVHFFTQVP